MVILVIRFDDFFKFLPHLDFKTVKFLLFDPGCFICKNVDKPVQQVILTRLVIYD